MTWTQGNTEVVPQSQPSTEDAPPSFTWWTVVYETRQRGALGIFEPKEFRVYAGNRAHAIGLAMHSAHQLGLETRFPVKVEADPLDLYLAHVEGWTISTVPRVFPNKVVSITYVSRRDILCGLDGKSVYLFDSDVAALTHVKARAEAGSIYHQRALALLTKE